VALGRLVVQKGFRELLTAFAIAEVENLDLLLAGEGIEEARLRALALELGISSRVFFLGRADRDKVGLLMRGACGLVVPSLREPMGIVALEGMAAGKPLLVSSVGGLQEVAPPSPWCMHNSPGDVAGLARGLRWLAQFRSGIEVPEQRERARSFLWDNITCDYLEIYRGVTRGGSKWSERPAISAVPAF
jgi:glycosyltransferase involved in cell wall biosynthesis